MRIWHLYPLLARISAVWGTLGTYIRFRRHLYPLCWYLYTKIMARISAIKFSNTLRNLAYKAIFNGYNIIKTEIKYIYFNTSFSFGIKIENQVKSK